ncbi:MAG: hypothetical protein HRU07_04870 [Nitrosopumilus sp.]|nr:hypothetical protein [Nitrosopumilus sp.]NRA05485.1 hypothetical protein [Nitrosopumilus sp.]
MDLSGADWVELNSETLATPDITLAATFTTDGQTGPSVSTQTTGATYARDASAPTFTVAIDYSANTVTFNFNEPMDTITAVNLGDFIFEDASAHDDDYQLDETGSVGSTGDAGTTSVVYAMSATDELGLKAISNNPTLIDVVIEDASLAPFSNGNVNVQILHKLLVLQLLDLLTLLNLYYLLGL